MKEENNSLLNKSKSSEWDEGIFIVLMAMIILIPIVLYPYCVPVFAPIKDYSFQILAFFSLTLWMLKIISLNRLDRKISSLDKPVFLYLLIGCLSLIWSINLYHSILALPSFLAGPVLYFVIPRSIKSRKVINRLLFIIIIVGIIMGAYGILQYLGIDFKFWKGNVGRSQVMGLFGNVNYFAEYIILPLMLSLGLFFSKEKIFHRFFLLIALIIMGTTLLLTFTRGSYLAVGITIPVILFLYHQSATGESQKKYYRKLIVYFLLLVMIASALVFIPHPFNKENMPLGKLKNRVSITALTPGDSRDSVLRRIATWKFTWMMIEDRFILGSGLGTYGYHSLKYQADFFSQGQNRDIYPHGYAMQAHNEYLQIWSELGIIGLFCFIWILFVYYRTILIHFRKMKEKDKALPIGLAGCVTVVLLDAVFGFPLQLAASLSLFWIFMGLTGAQINLANAAEKENKAQVQRKVDMGNRIITKLPMAIMIRKIILSLLVVLMMVGVITLFIRPFVARIYWYHGNHQRSYNEKIQMYEKGLQWNPWLGELYYNIATILSNNGLNTPALEYYIKAAKYVDQHYLPQNIAKIYLQKDSLEEAIPYLEKAIVYQPSRQDMVPLYISLGKTFLSLKQNQKAEQSFLSAISIDPGDVNAHYELAVAYLSQGKTELGKESLQKVIDLDPNSKVAGYAGVLLKKYELEDTRSEDLVD